MRQFLRKFPLQNWRTFTSNPPIYKKTFANLFSNSIFALLFQFIANLRSGQQQPVYSLKKLNFGASWFFWSVFNIQVGMRN